MFRHDAGLAFRKIGGFLGVHVVFVLRLALLVDCFVARCQGSLYLQGEIRFQLADDS